MSVSTVVRPLRFEDSGLKRSDWNKLKKLSNPKALQDFLNSLPFNFEKTGETHFSVRKTLARGSAHCFEAALVAAASFWIAGRRPLILDLVTVRPDLDHVVTLFQENGYWGAVSKTNHTVLRYRDPVYKTVRELVMSYFHEYFLFDGKKTLRAYSWPFDLSKLSTAWITTEESLADLAHALDSSPHVKILSIKQIRSLRKADKIEIEASKIVEYK